MERDDVVIHEGAERLGYASSSCDTCGARGRTELRVAAGSGGAASDTECPDCGGSGRWWYPDTRLIGSFTAHLTDAELRILLRAATSGAPAGERPALAGRRVLQ